MRFARELVKMASSLALSAQGCPPLPRDGCPAALETFASMQYNQHEGSFDFANFAELYVYLRGGVGLEFPNQAWKDVLPRKAPGQAQGS